MTYDAQAVRAMIAAEVGKIEKRMKAKRGGQAILARKIGCSRAFLNDVLLGGREPTGVVLKYFNLERFVVYATPDVPILKEQGHAGPRHNHRSR